MAKPIEDSQQYSTSCPQSLDEFGLGTFAEEADPFAKRPSQVSIGEVGFMAAGGADKAFRIFGGLLGIGENGEDDAKQNHLEFSEETLDMLRKVYDRALQSMPLYQIQVPN